MKKLAIVFFVILLLCFLGNLFMLPLYPKRKHSQSIERSKKLNAFISEGKIIAIDTLQDKYEFPNIRSIWVEYYWDYVRNKWGVVVPVVDMERPANSIIFDLTSTDGTFYSRFSSDWVIRENLTYRGHGSYGNKYYLDGNYGKGDTLSFSVCRVRRLKGREDEYISLFNFTIACE